MDPASNYQMGNPEAETLCAISQKQKQSTYFGRIVSKEIGSNGRWSYWKNTSCLVASNNPDDLVLKAPQCYISDISLWAFADYVREVEIMQYGPIEELYIFMALERRKWI